MEFLAPFTFILFVFCTLFLMPEYVEERRVLSVLRSREFLSDDEIYRSFYASSGLDKESVMELWHEIAKTLGISEGYLRPNDKFGKDIGYQAVFTNELDDLSYIALHRIKEQQLSVDLSLVLTVDDYVKSFARPCTAMIQM